MEKLAEKIKIALCKNNPALTVEQGETIQFGLECILNEASKIIAYFLIFALFSLTGHYLIAVAYFTVSRVFAGGYHAETYLKCFLVSFIILSAGIIIGSQWGLPLTARIILQLASIAMAWIFAPVDHPNKPIISVERRKRFKYLSVIVFIILASITFLLEERLAATAVMILFIEALSLPAGKITKRRISI